MDDWQSLAGPLFQAVLIPILIGYISTRVSTASSLKKFKSEKVHEFKFEAYRNFAESVDGLVRAIEESNRAELETARYDPKILDNAFTEFEKTRFYLELAADPNSFDRIWKSFERFREIFMRIDPSDPDLRTVGTTDGVKSKQALVDFRRIVVAEARREMSSR